METEHVKKPLPSPQERPDLYDDYDIPADSGKPNPSKLPDRIQKMMAERQGKQQPQQKLQAAE